MNFSVPIAIWFLATFTLSNQGEINTNKVNEEGTKLGPVRAFTGLNRAFHILYWLKMSSFPQNIVDAWSGKIDKALNRHCILCFKVNIENISHIEK